MTSIDLNALFLQNPEKNRTESGTLYLVATPIGNRMDISLRALKVLSEVDFIAAEDTRNSGQLLSSYGIDKPYVSYHEHNQRARGAEIAARLKTGESCALVTDAGMPAISDPGAALVVLCREEQIPVRCIPGASASVSALALSALPTDRFVFEGFLPTLKKDRSARLAALREETRTAILYEAPHRLRRTLADLASLGDRPLSVCRELTKINEETLFLSTRSAVDYYEQREPRGEYVLVLGGADPDAEKQDAFWRDMTVTQHVDYYLDTVGMTKKTDAVRAAAQDRGIPKGVLYRMLLDEAPEAGDGPSRKE